MLLSTIYRDGFCVKTYVTETVDKNIDILGCKVFAEDGTYILTTKKFISGIDTKEIENFRDCAVAKAKFKIEEEKGMVSFTSNYTFGDVSKADALIKTIVNEYDKRNMQMIATKYFGIKHVIFNPPATIVMWADGTKTVVKAQNEDFDPEKGLAMAFARKALGNKHSYYDVIRKHTKKFKK